MDQVWGVMYPIIQNLRLGGGDLLIGRSPSRREISPTQHRSSRRNGLDAREKHSGRAKSPKRAPSSSPVARLPSSQTKRLRRAQAEREVERETEKTSI